MTYSGIFDLSGKTAVVTGARKGIGFAMASILAEFGADIIAVSSKQESNDELENLPVAWRHVEAVKLFSPRRCGLS